MSNLVTIAECVRAELQRFFAPTVRIELKLDHHYEQDSLDRSTPTLSCSNNCIEFLIVRFTDDTATVGATFFSTLGGGVSRHEYCHPGFPSTILFSIAKICRRSENFVRIQAEACELADEDPSGGFAYFLKEMKNDVLLGRFMDDNALLVLPFMMSGATSDVVAVKKWINGFTLPPVEHYG